MQISDAIQAVLKAEEDFRSNMHRDWEGDPLSDAIDAMRAAFAASQDAPASAVRVKPLEDQVEELAKWLHDEVQWPEFDFPFHSWPDHPDDDGRRGDGFLKIMPPAAVDQFRELASRILSTVAAPIPQAAEWRDISTAPKDGSKIDVWGEFETGLRRVPDAYWNSEMNDWQLGQFNAAQFMFRPRITHWMPVPAAPTPKAESDG